MFAAITAAQNGSRVLLLEKNSRLGKKLLITGKGRCNVTNNCSAQEVLQNTPRNGRFLFSAMAAFPPENNLLFRNKWVPAENRAGEPGIPFVGSLPVRSGLPAGYAPQAACCGQGGDG